MSPKLLVPATLFLSAFLSYSNCFNHTFLLDDWTLILPSSFDPYFLQILGTHTTAVYYRPLLHALCALNHGLFGTNVFGYHLVNLLIFYLSGLSFYVLVKRLFNQPLLAFLSALLFLCHPINGVLVNYKIAVGYGFMILAANLSLLAMLRAPLNRNSSIVSVAWFLAALLCHETMSVFPLYLLAMLMIALKKSFREAVIIAAPHLLVLFLYLYQRALFTAGSAGLAKTIAGCGLSLFDATALWSQLAKWYFSQLIAPNQIVLVKNATINSSQIWNDNVLFVLMTSVLICLWKYSKSSPSARLGLSWLVINFLPATVASISRPEMGAILQPHWMTFGSLGFFLWLSGVLTAFTKDVRRPISVTVLMIILSSYVLGSRLNNQNWQDQKTYCLYWLKSSPTNFWAHFSLGQCYFAEGNLKRARDHFERAIVDGRAGYQVWQNLGLAEYYLENYDKAEMYFHGVLAASASDPLATEYLRKIQSKKSNPQE